MKSIGREGGGERVGERLAGVALDGQAAALLGTVGGEAGDDEPSTGRDRCGCGVGVALLIAGSGEEVEHGPVVPQLVAASRAVGGDLGGDPADLLGERAEATLPWASAASEMSSTLTSR